MTVVHYAVRLRCDLCGVTKDIETGDQVDDWERTLRISTDNGALPPADLCFTCANLPLRTVIHHLSKDRS